MTSLDRSGYNKRQMGTYGDFYNKSKKKKSKDELARTAQRQVSMYTPPQPIVIGRKKKIGQETNF